MGLFSRRIRVTLIDDRSNTIIGVTELTAEELPPAFFASTTLRLGEQEWSVVSADPLTRVEYCECRRLALRVRPLEYSNAGELLYSLPTICDELPISEGPEADGAEVVLREDDWRQCELVSDRFRGVVEDEIAAIRAIHAEHSVGLGFRNVHVRRLLPDPLADGRVVLTSIQALVGGRAQKPLRFDGTGTRVSSGFGFEFANNDVLYGVVSGSDVKILGFHPAPAVALDGLRVFARGYGLIAVDWCRCLAADPNDDSFESAIRGVG
jgi:hypothetical protein